jgi:hypothetical protein
MKRSTFFLLSLCCLLAFPTLNLSAAGKKTQHSTKQAYVERGPFGLGLYFGQPTGITARYFFDETSSVTGTLAFSIGSNSINLQGDYNYHFRKVLMIEKEEIIPSIGIGAYFGIAGGHADVVWAGIRVPFGLSYQLRVFPLEISLEAVPSWEFVQDGGFGMGGGMGLRYFFK